VVRKKHGSGGGRGTEAQDVADTDAEGKKKKKHMRSQKKKENVMHVDIHSHSGKEKVVTVRHVVAPDGKPAMMATVEQKPWVQVFEEARTTEPLLGPGPSEAITGGRYDASVCKEQLTAILDEAEAGALARPQSPIYVYRGLANYPTREMHS
jgi:hypothetical protein